MAGCRGWRAGLALGWGPQFLVTRRVPQTKTGATMPFRTCPQKSPTVMSAVSCCRAGPSAHGGKAPPRMWPQEPGLSGGRGFETGCACHVVLHPGSPGQSGRRVGRSRTMQFPWIPWFWVSVISAAHKARATPNYRGTEDVRRVPHEAGQRRGCRTLRTSVQMGALSPKDPQWTGTQKVPLGCRRLLPAWLRAEITRWSGLLGYLPASLAKAAQERAPGHQGDCPPVDTSGTSTKT